MRKFITSALVAAGLAATAATGAHASSGGGHLDIKTPDWSWQGIFGHFKEDQLQRGFKVYQKVCATCHNLKHLYYRNLEQIGLPESRVEEIAPGKPREHFQAGMAKSTAMATFNTVPPDLTLMAEARPGGPDYLYKFLLSFERREGHTKLYNKAFGNFVSMPRPTWAAASYANEPVEGTKEQKAEDVTAFLRWASEPNLEARHELGIKVILFLIVLSALFYALKRRIWADVH